MESHNKVFEHSSGEIEEETRDDHGRGKVQRPNCSQNEEERRHLCWQWVVLRWCQDQILVNRHFNQPCVVVRINRSENACNSNRDPNRGRSAHAPTANKAARTTGCWFTSCGSPCHQSHRNHRAPVDRLQLLYNYRCLLLVYMQWETVPSRWVIWYAHLSSYFIGVLVGKTRENMDKLANWWVGYLYKPNGPDGPDPR